MRYWLYKCNTEGGPAGYWGDWLSMIFHKKTPTEWGGHDVTRSRQARSVIENDVSVGDVVVAYQTDDQVVVGFWAITKITVPAGDRNFFLKPIERLPAPFEIHKKKAGTSLASSWAVRGPVMLAELSKENVEDILTLTGAPKRLLQGKPAPCGYRP